MHSRFNKILKSLNIFLGGRTFFLLIIALMTIQGIWYALTFTPILFDETKHFGFVDMYSSRILPFISYQTSEWNFLGDITRNGSYLFFYLMSFPHRILQLFTDSSTIQLAVLRMFSVGMFAIGLVYFRRMFLFAKIDGRLINIGSLILVLIPAFAPLSGVLSYDPAQFMLAGIVSYIAARLITAKKLDVTLLMVFVATAGIATIIKLSSIPFMAATLGYVFVVYWLRYGRNIFKEIKKSAVKTSRSRLLVCGMFLLAATLLVIERPIANIVSYKSPEPSCVQVRDAKSCYEDYVSKRDQDFLKIKPEGFQPVNAFEYANLAWIPGMAKTTVRQYHEGPLFPVLYLLTYITAIAGISVILINIRKIISNKLYLFMAVVTIIYTLFFFVQVYTSYQRLALPVAISTRYMLPVAPFILILVLVSLKDIVASRYLNLVFATIAISSILLLSQGAGIIGYVVAIDNPGYYINQSPLEGLNELVDKAGHKIGIGY